MKYNGMFKATHKKPDGDYIELFVSDWNKDYWGFYTYIEKDNYEEDIDNINNLITKLNWRDGDYYIELIDYKGDLEYFYHYIYENNNYTHSAILNSKYWEILEEKGNNHFLYFDKLIGSGDIDELEEAEFYIYEDWEEVLETYNPDLYKALEENNGLGCFEISQFFNYQGFTEIEGLIISGGC